MKGEPLDVPKGRILYTDANGATGIFINGPYMAGFCSAVEILITQWHEHDKASRAPDARMSREAQEQGERCEMITDRLKGMLETVTILGIEPLVTWLTGRLEQEDI